MLAIVCIFFVFASSHGHTNKIQSEAEMQSALMPQELNPAFVPENTPWRAVFPISRLRRDADLSVEPSTAISEKVKEYSRIIAFIVLLASAVSEIILYLIDLYYTRI